ncbi:TRAP transporter small permease [Oricola sp.]|uniref:TRAP transporter small permease n=1 Tax=Oricola sp. TaxID=1979950 RepID=UPI0025D0E7D3|nr:TRAP transporter small permease [Oricola sp.]MCI5078096.1 TRAP transporter small permease [Oricola sp.]
MNTVERLLRILTRIGALIGITSIASLMLLTVVTVVFRAVGIAFPGTYVLAELLLIPAISFSLVYAAWEKGHTRVDLLISRFPERVQSLLEALMLALGTIFWAFISWSAIREALIRQAQNERAPLLDFPVAPFRWVMAAALVLLCCVLVFQVGRAIQATVARNTPSMDEDA